jgi:hypothetical protein
MWWKRAASTFRCSSETHPDYYLVSSRNNTLKTEFLLNDSISIQFALHRKHYLSATKLNRLMLLGKLSLCIARTVGDTNILCG